MPKISFAPPFASYIGRDSSRSTDAGQVLYELENRPVARAFARPANPRSLAQTSARALFASAAQEWNTLTDSEQAEWQALGNTITKIDAAGNSYRLSGRSVYVESFCNAFQAGGSPGTTPAPFASAPTITAITSLTHSLITNDLTLVFATAAMDGGATVWLSPPLGSGVRKPNTPTLRLCADPPDAFADFSSSNTTFVLTDADGRFTIATGDRVAVRMRPLDPNNALRGIDFATILTVA